jgi:hypothetical protein
MKEINYDYNVRVGDTLIVEESDDDDVDHLVGKRLEIINYEEKESEDDGCVLIWLTTLDTDCNKYTFEMDMLKAVVYRPEFIFNENMYD